MRSLLLSLALLLPHNAQGAEPSSGWGPHFVACLPGLDRQGFATLNALTPTADAQSQTLELKDANGLLAWRKRVTIWRQSCANNPDFPALFVRTEHLDDGTRADENPYLLHIDLEFTQGTTQEHAAQMSLCSNISDCRRTLLDFDLEKLTILIPHTANSRVNFKDAFDFAIFNTQFRFAVPALGTAPPPATVQAAALSGTWYDPSKTGSGFFATGTPQGLVLAWFGHGNDGRKQWLISEPAPRTITVGQAYRLDLFEATSGSFTSPNPDLITWGFVDLTFGSCDAAVARMQGRDGTDDLDLLRLSGIDGMACQIGR